MKPFLRVLAIGALVLPVAANGNNVASVNHGGNTDFIEGGTNGAARTGVAGATAGTNSVIKSRERARQDYQVPGAAVDVRSHSSAYGHSAAGRHGYDSRPNMDRSDTN